MGQVPAFTSYLVIGDGRVARHFRRYFEFEALPFYSWSRKQNSESELRSLADASSHILLLLSDRAIEPFLQAHRYLADRVCVHMSGSLTLSDIPSVHPLMTFSDTLYEHEFYRRIPFVIEQNSGGLSRLLPGLPNPSFELNRELKSLYHAYCVLAGNFSVILWEKVFREFSSKLNLPKEALVPYLTQTASNLATADAGKSVLTGPLARADHATIERNLSALTQDPFREVYRAFVHAFHQEVPHEVGSRLS